jgi:hypothetical protein
MNVDRRARIRLLNDRLRRLQLGGRIMLTRGVVELGPEKVQEALQLVAHFDTFDLANDPYGERDFGAVQFDGQRMFWKIDYLDPTLTVGADDPADETTCVRVLTVMLASEY